MATRYRKEDPLASVIDANGTVSKNINRILHAARTHLGMEVAFISQFMEKERIFRHVDCDDWCPLQPGDSLPLEQGYCQRIVQGRLPELMADTSEVPAALELPDTRALPIGSHLGVPIRLDDGALYGSFCCFSSTPDRSLNERDLGMMRTLAELIGHQLDSDLQAMREREQVVRRLESAMEMGQPSIVYQPIFGLDQQGVAGVECLARFKLNPARSPDVWFNEAASVGLGPPLELLAIRTALDELSRLPGDFYISINSSPQTLFSEELAETLRILPPERLVLELTEHDHVDDYDALLDALAPLRAAGIRIAIDDAGAGYASMRHILSMQPELIKLDISLTQNINGDTRRCALASALVEFARHTGSTIIAEGVETAAELDTLYALGVRRIQGFHLSRPLPLQGLSELLSQQT